MLKGLFKGLLISALSLGLLILGVSSALAQTTPAANSTTQVTLISDNSARTFKGGLVRGDRATYAVAGKQGQALVLSLTSLENNAVFDVVDPSGKVIKSGATGWVGLLPVNGNYKVIIGGTRGNASYVLTLAQTEPDYQTEVKTNTICSFINANDVNLRKDPSTNAAVVTQFKRGDVVRATRRSGDWVSVVARVSGQSPEIYSPIDGYVSNRYINGCSEDQFDRWRK